MLDPTKLRERLLRGMREGHGGACTVKITLIGGTHFTAKVTSDAAPSTWSVGEIVLFDESRGGTRFEHHVALNQIAVLTVVTT